MNVNVTLGDINSGTFSGLRWKLDEHETFLSKLFQNKLSNIYKDQNTYLKDPSGKLFINIHVYIAYPLGSLSF